MSDGTTRAIHETREQYPDGVPDNFIASKKEHCDHCHCWHSQGEAHSCIGKRFTALRTAAIAFLNEAPLEGDYRLALLSMTGGNRESLDKITAMGNTYAEKREALRAAIAKAEVRS
jgi:hypothetical protein